ncbi:hypothetical protein ACHAPT_004236 [Fusarium lateritium]
MLLVGPKLVEKIQTSSHLLSIASPVFKAMFQFNFKEGKALRERNDSPVEIELPDDSAEAVWNAFSILYGADPTMKGLTPKQILGVASVADKYRMVDRFSFAVALWVRPNQATEPQATWGLMLAAYMLKYPPGLLFYSKKFIANKSLSLVQYTSKMSDWTLGLKFCLAIEEFRSRNLTHAGICLHCFDTVEMTGLGFTQKSVTCKDPTHVAR